MIKKIMFIAALLCGTLMAAAQTATESDHIRRGNRHYADSLFERAEVEYRKALELNAESVDAMYNLAGALFSQIPQAGDKAGDKGQEAMKLYLTASQLETDKARLAQIYHNLGTLMYMAQQYPQSVEAYKESLRNNPHDNETRYNLAKAMHMLKQQDQQNQQDQEQQEDKQDQQQDQQQEQQQNQQQEQQQQEQQQMQEEQQQQEQSQEQQRQQQQSRQEEEQISKENAEQILNALMQDEKDIQERQKQMMQQQRGKSLDKDW